MSLLTILGAVTGVVGKVVDRAVPDASEANRLKNDLFQAIMASGNAEMQAAASIIVAEAQGESWLQRNWRPVLMLVIVAIVGNNYLLAPYINALFGNMVPVLELPARLWDLMTLGVGGYIAGRSGEKMLDTWAKTKS